MDDEWHYPTARKQWHSNIAGELNELHNLFILRTDGDQYDESRTFSEELRRHIDRPIWVFDYSEEVKRKTIHRYQSMRNKLRSYSSPSSPNKGTLIEDDCETDKPSSSKIFENQTTPHSHNINRVDPPRESNTDHILHTDSRIERSTPLPILNFADSNEVWLNMVYKEEATLNTRNSKVFADRSSYLPRMRAILLDWLMEVCEVYHLRRNTYYLSIDYVDRYLTIKPTVPKTHLQLLGVSCLFIAAKLEEIYPPKLSEFSYLCDGACEPIEILSCEILLLNTLGWDVNPMTPTNWLNLYMQIYYNSENLKKQRLHQGVSNNFQFPQYSAYQFVRASHLIDLFSMDPGFLRFSYSVIAAAAMFYIFGKEVALMVSGFTWEQTEDCVEYMSVFDQLIKESTDQRLQCVISQDADDRQSATFRSLRKSVPCLVPDESHCMQTHVIDIEYFEKATVLRLEQLGMRVEKTLVKKRKKIEKPPPPALEEVGQEGSIINDVQNSEPQEEETTIVMYEIEKILDEQIDKCKDILGLEDLSEDKHITEGKSSNVIANTDDSSNRNKGSINILKIEKKTKLSFDDILSSIHNDYYDNKIQILRLK